MSNYINQVSDSLKNHISELANNPCLFLRNPNVDFSRKRKIDFKTFIGIMMNSGGATMSKELLDFFDFNKNTPSVSAFTQQRSKVLPEAFEYLFKSFTDGNLPTTNNYHGYRLIAWAPIHLIASQVCVPLRYRTPQHLPTLHKNPVFHLSF